MITRTHNADCPQEYLTAFGLDPAKVIYFDIETTGFRASTSRLYMIGWAVQGTDACKDESDCLPAHLSDHPGSDCSASGEHWTVTQIMAESSAEEVLLLREFEKVLSRYDTIIEFNGDRFDLPYMKEKYAACSLNDPFVHCRTVDLYREIKPFKNVLGLSRLNQKSVEAFLHITRDDPYNGGELIDVYRSFRSHTCADEENAIDALFLHNYEDVLGMMKMTPLLSYHLAMHSTAPVTVYPGGAASHDLGYEILKAHFDLDVPVPVPVHLDLGRKIQDHLADSFYEPVSHIQDCEQNTDRITSDRDDLPDAACSITLSENHAAITLRLLPLNLYHYFPDYRNYYYLPEEDTAIHKSVAAYVDASHREKAKAQNCYIKKSGLFLPQAEDHYQPAFHRFYKDSVSWFEYRQELIEDSDEVSAYIHSLILSSSFIKE